ncbi:hypothetical protein PG995_011724 [Apiospora arundinis]
MTIGRSLVYRKGIVTVLLIATAQAGDVLSPWAAGPNKDYSNNPLLSVGVTITFKWQLNKGTGLCKLRLFQDNFPGDTVAGPWVDIATNYQDKIKDPIYSWTVTKTKLDPKFNNVYYLLVDNGEDEATTHYFNITDTDTPKASSTSTTATSSPTVSSTLAPSTSPTVLITATVWQTAASTAGTSAENSPPTTGSLVGIIVGVVAALVLLLAGMWWAFLVWKKKKGGRQDTVTPFIPQPATSGNDSNKQGNGTEIGGNPMNEAETRPYVPPVYEADGTQIQQPWLNYQAHDGRQSTT